MKAMVGIQFKKFELFFLPPPPTPDPWTPDRKSVTMVIHGYLGYCGYCGYGWLLWLL